MRRRASMRVRGLEIAILALVAPVQVIAASVSVTNAWIRALPAHLPAAAYFSIRNDGDDDLTITGAQSPACGMLMLHQSSNAGGMDKMQDVEDITVPAHSSVAL